MRGYKEILWDYMMKKYNIDINIPRGAIFSDDRVYRYALWRIWSINKPLLLTIGLNPSKANESSDDPTITRLMTRAFRTGYGGLLMSNLYAYVSTNPDNLLNYSDTIGELTDDYIKEMVELSSTQLCGWGSFEPVIKRADVVYNMLPQPVCLGINADGNPKHPLYISYNMPMLYYERTNVD